jgi:TrmH family RNA methyltransferase
MLSKAQIKYIRSLNQQKYRKEHQAFVAEGDKIVREWLDSDAPIEQIAAIESWANENDALIAKHPGAAVHIISEQELDSISSLKTPNKVLITVAIPEVAESLPVSGWSLALENLQDPGNMGTIIRIADWFGIESIICSEDCVDVYNPKVVQSAMGGHLRVKLFEADLFEFSTLQKRPIIAATLNGKSLYDLAPFTEAVLLIGNESKGLTAPLMEQATYQATIPKRGGAESLNAAVSTGILCSHLLAH